MPAEALVFIAAALISGATFARLRGRRRVDERQQIIAALRATPRLAATSAAGTNVVAIGIVRPVAPEVDGPFSGRPCVAYRARAYRGSIENHKQYWEQSAAVPFALECEDATRVLIESAHAVFAFPALPLPPDAPERCVEFALAQGITTKDLRRITYEELIVLEGMRVAVGGRLARDGDVTKVVGDKSPIIIGVPF